MCGYFGTISQEQCIFDIKLTNAIHNGAFKRIVTLEYCKPGNFRVGEFSRFLRSCRENYPHAKIKPMYLYEGNKSNIVKISPT